MTDKPDNDDPHETDSSLHLHATSGRKPTVQDVMRMSAAMMHNMLTSQGEVVELTTFHDFVRLYVTRGSETRTHFILCPRRVKQGYVELYIADERQLFPPSGRIPVRRIPITLKVGRHELPS